jgi:hypothetical protein
MSSIRFHPTDNKLMSMLLILILIATLTHIDDSLFVNNESVKPVGLCQSMEIVESWTRIDDSVTEDELFLTYYYDVSVDSQGHIYVLGETELDLFVRLYNEQGDVIWTKQIGTRMYASGR